jgi:hypothetical protein
MSQRHKPVFIIADIALLPLTTESDAIEDVQKVFGTYFENQQHTDSYRAFSKVRNP